MTPELQEAKEAVIAAAKELHRVYANFTSIKNKLEIVRLEFSETVYRLQEIESKENIK